MLVHGNGKLVTVLGLEDIVVVETKDAMMVAHKDKVQDVKKLVSKLDAQERSETKNHCAVCPWGWYDSVDMGGRFQVKRICVNPAPASRCRCTTTVPSTGSWYPAPLR